MQDQERTVDTFDRIIGQIDGLPDVHRAKPSTVSTVMPIIGNAQTYVVQTYKGDDGFYVFLQMVDKDGGVRFAIPPKVASAIYRQRDALVKASRRAAGQNRWDHMSHTDRAAQVARLRRPRKEA